MATVFSKDASMETLCQMQVSVCYSYIHALTGVGDSVHISIYMYVKLYS